VSAGASDESADDASREERDHGSDAPRARGSPVARERAYWRPSNAAVLSAASWLAVRVGVALGISAPAEALVVSITRRMPGGERALVDWGGVMLVDATKRFSELGLGRGAAAWLVALGVALALIPYGAAIAAFAERGFTFGEALARGASKWPRLLLLTGGAWLAVVMLGGACAWVAAAVARGIDAGTAGSVERVGVGAVLYLLATLPIAMLSILVDGARAHAVIGDGGAARDVVMAARLLRRRGLRLFGWYAASVLLSVALAVGAVAAGLWAFSGHGDYFGAAMLQILAALGIFALRATFVRAVALDVRALVDEPPPRRPSDPTESPRPSARAGAAPEDAPVAPLGATHSEARPAPPDAAGAPSEDGGASSQDPARQSEEALRPSGPVE